MKKLILILGLVFALGCEINNPQPTNIVNVNLVTNGFSITQESNNIIDTMLVYTNGIILDNGTSLFKDNEYNIRVSNGVYFYEINEVFYNEFHINNGVITLIKTLTY